ncbi:MAG TPA: hypothetical protein VGN63_18780 [Flavisolibacter sp.]|jgi:hypothetical protein|nr:hypothetical protein [Flavisolibacter sp.]
MVNDYAIVVGLKKYPGLDKSQKPLEGPENDAMDFYNWVLSSKGGQVPKDQIQLILSSHFPSVNSDDFMDAKPAEIEIGKAFQRLWDLAKANQKNRKPAKVGRRLYIFMSGHGIAPQHFGNKIEKESALLMSNVDPDNMAAPRYHIPGTYVANWFCENDLFDEIFLFMDCCRDKVTAASINTFLPAKGDSDKAKRFYAFASRWSRKTRERPMPDENNKVRGVFTKTLLKALEGAAAMAEKNNKLFGHITFESLQSYLINNMKHFMDTPSPTDSEPVEPDVDYFPKSARDTVVVGTSVPDFEVTIKAPAGASGEVGVYSSVLKAYVKRFQAAELPKQIALPREEYILVATVNGQLYSEPIKVEGV